MARSKKVLMEENQRINELAHLLIVAQKAGVQTRRSGSNQTHDAG